MSLRIWGLRLQVSGEWLGALGLLAAVAGLAVPLGRAALVPGPVLAEPTTERRRGPLADDAPSAFEAAGRSPYPDLAELKKEGEARLGNPGAKESDGSAPRLRDLFVTSPGAGRSEIFVSGRRLGETPFVGQWSCRDGDTFRIDLVPPKGPATSLSMICRGERLEARGP